MTRYLLYISYLGTQFRSVQKQVTHAEPLKLDPASVQGILEICSKKFNPANEPCVYVSSRTDRGVHALRSSAHVDLVRRSHLKFEPAHLLLSYNKFLRKENVDLRIQAIKEVPDSFHARFNAKSRTYLYRLAVRKPDAPPVDTVGKAEIPLAEWKRCHFVPPLKPFNISLMKQAAAFFPGTRDFRTFMGVSSELTEEKNTVKELYKLDIVPGRPFLDVEYSPECEQYDFWNVICQSRSFLYRQVRRIVGTIIGVAQGRISLQEVKYMLEVPSKDSWNDCIEVVPPYGLYLVNVEYDPMDMVIPLETNKQESEVLNCSESALSL